MKTVAMESTYIYSYLAFNVGSLLTLITIFILYLFLSSYFLTLSGISLSAQFSFPVILSNLQHATHHPSHRRIGSRNQGLRSSWP